MPPGAPPGGMQPPTAAAPPAPGGIHPAGLHTRAMDMMKKIWGAFALYRAGLDPSTEESKVADKAFNLGRKHFIPDAESMVSGTVLPMGAPAGGPPQAGGQIPMAPPRPPTGPIGMRPPT